VVAGLFWQSGSDQAEPNVVVPMDIDATMSADVVVTEAEPLPALETNEPEVTEADAETGAPVVEAESTTTPIISQNAPPTIETLSFSFTGASWISVRDGTGQELVYGQKMPVSQ